MKELTKPVLKLLGADITAALEPLKKKYGLSELSYAGGTFEPGSARLKVKVVLEDGISREANRYNQLGHLLGLPPLDSNPTFKNAGIVYAIIGLTPGDKVLATNTENKKPYVFAFADVKKMLAREAAPLFGSSAKS